MTSSQPDILLIEDDLGVREGLANLLSVVAPVVSVDSWTKAVTHLGMDRVGLIVTDYRMREAEGEAELLAAARARGVPVILCTGAHPSELEQALAQFRPDRLFAKPFEVDAMLDAAQRLYQR
jgi:DNA-binding NtrC family response regulator